MAESILLNYAGSVDDDDNDDDNDDDENDDHNDDNDDDDHNENIFERFLVVHMDLKNTIFKVS